MNTLQDRLKQFITSLDSSVLSFENKCGMAPGTVNKMTDKSRAKTLEKIRKAFPQLNMEWLQTGAGEMLTPQQIQKKYEVGIGIGEQSGGIAEFKFDIEKELVEEVDIDDNAVCKRHYKRLKALLEKANREIARLEGKLEEQEKFIDKLLAKK